MTSILREREAALREAQHQVYLGQLRALHRLAIAAWVFYIAFDYIATLLPGTPQFSSLVIVRLTVAGLIATALFLLSRFRLSHPVVRFFDLLLLIEPTALITYFCWREGIGTTWVAGYAFAITCRGGLIREVWWRTLLHLSPPILGVMLCPLIAHGFPGVFGSHVASTLELVTYSHNAFIVASTAIFATTGAHAAWKMEQGAFEGRSIGRYRLQQCIGKGAMGEVWSARDTSIKRDVALKVMMLTDTSRPAQVRARFDREIRALMALDHPHAVRILDFGTVGDRINYFTMDLLVGCDLAQLVRKEGRLPPLRVLALLEQAARAVAQAHRLGIVHRDIKPSNLFISDVGDDVGHVRLLDFGIAKLDDDTDESLTATGAFVGTAHFAAPELALGKDATAASDIYALGAVAYYALTGRTPFAGLTLAGVLGALVSGEITPLEELSPGLDPEVTAIVRQAMSPKPEQRFATAAALADALRNALWRLRAQGVSPIDAPALPSEPVSEEGVSTVDGPALASAPARQAS